MEEIIELARIYPRERGAPGVDPVDGREFQEAATVEAFVPLLLARLPPVVKDLLTMFNSTGCPACTSGQAQDGLVLQAIQGTEVYREVARLQGFGGASGGYDDGTLAARRDEPDGATQSGSCPEGARCGCSSRHVLSIMTYAMLTMLHKRDAAAAAVSSSGGGAGVISSGGVVGAAVVGEGEAGKKEPVWHRDPLATLPKPVADEALHVAGMLEGLVEMEECEKCGV